MYFQKMVSSVLLKPVWTQALASRAPGGMAFMQTRKGGVSSFGLPRFPAAYCTVTIMSFFVLLSAAPIDIVMVLSFSAVGASS